MSKEAEIIEGKLAEYLEQYPGLKELLAARCKACKLYGQQIRRDGVRAAKLREAEIMAREPCLKCGGRKVCKHQPLNLGDTF